MVTASVLQLWICFALQATPLLRKTACIVENTVTVSKITQLSQKCEKPTRTCLKEILK